MKYVNVLFALIVVATTSISASAEVPFDPTRLMGTWMNDDANGGLTKIEVAFDEDKGLSIHAWGHCQPTDCDGGVVYAHIYGKDVVDNAAIAFTAVDNVGWSRAIWTGIFENGKLTIRYFTLFTDKSRRVDYTEQETFSLQPKK